MAGKPYYRPIIAGDIAHVGNHLRDDDKREVIAMRGDVRSMQDVLALSVLCSTHCWAAVAPDHEPIALFGVAPVSLLGGIGSPWLLGTERTVRYASALVRQGRYYVQVMREAYPDLTNYVDARNERSIRWLQRLGFVLRECEPVGVMGMPFYRFEMRS